MGVCIVGWALIAARPMRPLLAALFICTFAPPSSLAQFDDVRAVGYLRDTSAVGGSVVSIDRDSITLRLDSASQRELMLGNIRTLAVIDRRSDIEGISAAMFTYTGAALVNGAENREGNFFVDDAWTATIGAVGGLVVGGLVGLVWGPREIDRRTEFSPADSASRAALHKHVLKSISPRPNWQIATCFGQVFGSIRSELPNQVVDYHYSNQRSGGGFTLLRRVELAHTMSGFELTANIALLDQPSSEGYDYVVDVNDPQRRRYYRGILEQYSGAGFLGGARYAVSLGSNDVLLRGGLSVGVAGSSLVRSDVDAIYSYYNETTATSAAALGSLDLIVRLHGLVLGISADYVAVPSMQIEASQELDLPASTVNMSSGCIGFTIGIEF